MKIDHHILIVGVLSLLMGMLIGSSCNRVGRYEYITARQTAYLYFDTATGKIEVVDLAVKPKKKVVPVVSKSKPVTRKPWVDYNRP